MFPKPISIDHVHVLYHRIVDVILRFVIYNWLPVDLNVVVRRHYDSIDLSIVERSRVKRLISFVNHEPERIFVRNDDIRSLVNRLLLDDNVKHRLDRIE